jgi:tuberous sclerosis protein 2
MISTKDSTDEDIPLRLKLLIAVTDNGKNNECIETKVGPTLIEWFDKIAKHFQRSVGEYLTLLVNVIKYNSSYLDQKSMADIIDKTYTLTKTANEELIYCYQILEAIVCHSTIPSISLTHFVIVLCKGVKTSLFNEICLKIMRNLLASHLGHSCVDTLRYLLNDQTNNEDIPLLVGAVNFISVFLWEKTRVQSIRHTPNAILPAFKSVLQCRHQLVALEVSSSLICLVDNQRNTMSDHTWDLMFDICEEIVSNYEICVENSGLEFNQKLHQFLDTVEDLNDKKQFFGDTNRLFNILEKCSLSRSVRKLFITQFICLLFL